MKDRSTSMDALMQRLEEAASELDVEHSPMSPPQTDWPRRIEELRAAHHVAYPLLDPLQPRLAELLVLDQDDETFLAGAYHHLLGRELDAEGRDYYLAETRHMGRLYVLACLYDAPECRANSEMRGMLLPRNRKLTLPRHLVLKLKGPLKRWGFRLLRGAFLWVTRYRAARWTLEAMVYRQQAEKAVWRDERDALLEAVEEMDARQRHLVSRQEHAHARQRQLWQQVAETRRRLYSATASMVPAVDMPAAQDAVRAEAPPTELDAYYLAFEDAFRGDEADISRHLEQYRDDWVRARQAGHRALDLGCGRGEWLRLLARQGFTPEGVDLNVTMVEHCRQAGFEAACQDAIAALAGRESDSLALISGFHIAEHLPFEALFRLIAEAHRVLAPGGVLILETPNPENLIVSSHSFYHDMTHRNPLTPATFEFLVGFHGFPEVLVRRFNPPPEETRVPGEGPMVERLNSMLCAPMDYAVVGIKQASSDAEGEA